MEEQNFDTWLSVCLNAAGLDGEVFSGYISGTLGTMEDSSPQEIEESLLDILQGCLEDEDVSTSLSKEIYKRWSEELERNALKDSKVSEETEFIPTTASSDKTDTSKVLGGGMGSKVAMSSEEKRRLIAQYDCESDEEDLKEKESKGIEGLSANYNSNSVDEVQRLHRDLLKAEHDAKVEQDRKQRDIQKQRAEERKEKEKRRTQKQEKRR